MFPKKGNLFPHGNGRENGRAELAAIVASALQSELGRSHRAVKMLIRWTGASERTAKQWLAGAHCPRGNHLVALLRECDAVFESLMIAANRWDAAVAVRALAAQTSLEDLLAGMGGRSLRTGGLQGRGYEGDRHDTSDAAADTGHDRENDRNDDRESDPDPKREGRPIRHLPREALNPRQHWYLGALGSGLDVRAADLKRNWGVSEKTARRDLAGLKARGMISFTGSRRAGRYRIEK